jgi:hypothetical protein
VEDVGIYLDDRPILLPFAISYGHFVYFVVIWYFIWSFGILYGHLVFYMVIWYIFSAFWYVVPRKIWQ